MMVASKHRRAHSIVASVGVVVALAGLAPDAGAQPLAPDRLVQAPATGTIAGTVVDARTSTPVPGVLVERQGSEQHALTGPDGTFELPAVPAGRQALYVSIIGYALARPSVDVQPGVTARIVVPLAEGTGAYTEQVTVTAPETRASAVVPASQTLTSAALQDLRGVLADDPLRAVQALPGVATGDDFRSEFSVRGSDFAHVGLSIDGVASRWLVHSVQGVEDTGSVSLLNGDVLDRMTLTSGVYPQRFGGRTGAWLETTIREGSRDAHAFRGAVSVTGATMVAEGPLGTRRAGSWLVSLRQSYLDWLLRRVAGDRGTVFGFTDTQAKVVYDFSPTQHAELTLVGGRSRFDEPDDDPGPNSLITGRSRTMLLTTAWRSTAGAAWVFDQRAAIVAGRFRNRGFFSQNLADGRFTDISLTSSASWAPSDSLLADASVRVAREHGARTLRTFGTAASGQVVPRGSAAFTGDAWRESLHANLRWTSRRGWTLNPGAIVSHHQATDEVNVAPWVTASLPLGSRFAVRGGLGLAQQPPELEQLLGPDGDPRLRSERARLADLAFSYEIGTATTATLSAYLRDERDVLRLEGDELRLVGTRTVAFQTPPRFRNALAGCARGVEATLRHASPTGLSGWVSYGFGRLRYDDRVTGESFWGDFDQRHAVNAYGQYRLSPRMSVSGKVRAGTNFPIAGYLVDRGGQLFIAARRNDVRLPTYVRVDVRANRTFNYSRRRLTLFVEAVNLLGRDNYGPADGAIRVRTGDAIGYREKLLPFLPSAGLTVEF